ncbi:MAG: hypothetical protein ACLTG4_09730 [Oscillospiraceae bacterium]
MRASLTACAGRQVIYGAGKRRSRSLASSIPAAQRAEDRAHHAHKPEAAAYRRSAQLTYDAASRIGTGRC